METSKIKAPKSTLFGVIAGNVAKLAIPQRNAKVISPWQIKIKLLKVKLILRQRSQLGIPTIHLQEDLLY